MMSFNKKLLDLDLILKFLKFFIHHSKLKIKFIIKKN